MARERNKTGRPRLPQHEFPGAKQVIIKCLSCEMEFHVWLHLEKMWPKLCTYCHKGRLVRK